MNYGKKPIESVLKCRFDDVRALNIHSNLHISSVILSLTHPQQQQHVFNKIRFAFVECMHEYEYCWSVDSRERFGSAQYAITAHEHTPHSTSFFHLRLTPPHSFPLAQCGSFHIYLSTSHHNIPHLLTFQSHRTSERDEKKCSQQTVIHIT